MLVRQPVITNQRVGDRRMSACEQTDARFEKYNTTFHATRAFVRSHHWILVIFCCCFICFFSLACHRDFFFVANGPTHTVSHLFTVLVVADMEHDGTCLLVRLRAMLREFFFICFPYRHVVVFVDLLTKTFCFDHVFSLLSIRFLSFLLHRDLTFTADCSTRDGNLLLLDVIVSGMRHDRTCLLVRLCAMSGRSSSDSLTVSTSLFTSISENSPPASFASASVFTISACAAAFFVSSFFLCFDSIPCLRLPLFL